MKLASVLRRFLSSHHRFQRVVVAVTVVTAGYLVALPTLVSAAGSAIYSAYGDSIAFGAFAPIGRGYVPLYANAIANDDNGVFVSGPTGPGNTDFDVFKPYLDDINAYIFSTSMAHGVLVAPVYDAFNGPLHDQDPGAAGLLAFDDFHPNAAGHALIAKKLRALGYFTVTP